MRSLPLHNGLSIGGQSTLVFGRLIFLILLVRYLRDEANSAQSFSAVQTRVAELIKDRILVGHGVQGDLAILKLSHPREKIRDTSLYEPFRAKYSAGKSPSLKKVVEGEVGVMIQSTEHDSVNLTQELC
jgi:DNA polymerase III epsilon subunit-like protein